MGDEYPAHFRFFERNGNPPVEGEEVGYVYEFRPDLNDNCEHIPDTRLVWKKGCVNQVSVKKT